MAGTDGKRWELIDGEWELVPEDQGVAVAEVKRPVGRPRIEADGRRECRTCGVVKPLAAYHADVKSRDGHRMHCIECTTQASRAYELARQKREAEARTVSWQSVDDVMHQAAAAFARWTQCDDLEERAGAREAAIYRARQLLAAVGG